jgi:cellulose synthase operon protein YhjQ
MPLVVVSSPKGGAGKTTLTANLAVGMRQRGWRVSAVDFDSQNALRFHLAPEAGDRDGLARATYEGRPWRTALVACRAGVQLIPFGPSTREARLHLDEALTTERLHAELADLERGPADLILVDTAPGEGLLQERLDELADVGLTVFLTDGGSIALLPNYRDGAFLRPPLPGEPPRFGVLNQVDKRRRLSRDIADFVADRAADRFLGAVRYDESVAEAAASGFTALEGEGEEDVGAVADIKRLAASLDRLVRDVSAA